MGPAPADRPDDGRWRIRLSPPHVGRRERELLLEALDAGWIAPAGPLVEDFEARVAALAGRSRAVALSSGTVALQQGLLALGVGPGDEVWCADLTVPATPEVILACGATPVFVDVEDRRWTMDPVVLGRALADAAEQGRLPAAIVPADAYGTVADHDALLPLAADHDVPVLVDAREAVGGRGPSGPAGSSGRAAVFSFDSDKLVTTSAGGALVTDDEDLVARVRGGPAPRRGAGVDEPSPGHDERLSDVLAGLGLGQLETLPERLARRREINARYRAALDPLPGISVWPIDPGSTRWLTQVLVDRGEAGVDREQVRRSLARRAIEARPVRTPLHIHPDHRRHRVVGGAVSEYLHDRGLCLPSGTTMSDEDVDEVIAVVTRLVPA